MISFSIRIVSGRFFHKGFFTYTLTVRGSEKTESLLAVRPPYTIILPAGDWGYTHTGDGDTSDRCAKSD